MTRETATDETVTEKKATSEYKVHGPGHVWAAFTFSLAGMKRVLQETAFRHAITLYMITNVIFWLIGSPWWGYFGLVAVLFAVGAAECLNTAIEELVDHVSPHHSQMAKHAKDLGSAAVMFMLLTGGVWVGVVIYVTIRHDFMP